MRSQDRGTPGLPREQGQPNPKQRLPSPGTQSAELPAELTQRRCCGKAARHPGSPPASRPGRAAPGSAAAPGPAPPDRYRPHLPRLCLGVSPPASWQRSLRHWKSNRNPAASLLLRSLAIARSLPRQLSGVRSARRSSFGVGKSGGGGGE